MPPDTLTTGLINMDNRINFDEAADIMDVSRGTIDRWVYQGLIPPCWSHSIELRSKRVSKSHGFRDTPSHGGLEFGRGQIKTGRLIVSENHPTLSLDWYLPRSGGGMSRFFIGDPGH